MISIIAAINKRRAIGKNGALLYRLPNDMRRFKSLTTGHTVIMGRRTFESLPGGALPDRRNIVLSRRPATSFAGAECMHSLSDALRACHGEEEVFIIGGESVYAEALPLADRLYITEVDDDRSDADAFFPDFRNDVWEEAARDERPADGKHRYAYSFIDFIRRQR